MGGVKLFTTHNVSIPYIDREQMHIAHRVVDRKLAIGDTIYWHSLIGERGTPLPAAA